MRSAASNSWVLTVRRPRIGSGAARHRSATFLSKAFRFDKCAAWHRAIALRNMVCTLTSQPAESARESTDTSGVSSKKAWLSSCISERTALLDLATIISWYCRADRRSCHGTQRMAWPGLRPWCTRLNRRMLGDVSLSSNSGVVGPECLF